jgi:hypothetical protein
MKTAQRGGHFERGGITYREAMLRERASAIAAGVSAKLVDGIIKRLGKNARPEELTDAIYKALARKARPAPPPKKTPKKVPAIEDEEELEEEEDEEEEEEELHDSDDDDGQEEEDEERTPFRGKSKRKKAALPSCGILNMQAPDFTPPAFRPRVMRDRLTDREHARAAAAKLIGARPQDVAHLDDTTLLAVASARLQTTKGTRR